MQHVKDEIGAEGATFANSLLNFSLCCPSRATFLTGQYADNHAFWTTPLPTAVSAAFESCTLDNNLAVWLQDAGYHTARSAST